MHELKYLAGYPEPVRNRVRQLITEAQLGSALLKRYPTAHTIRTDRQLYDYTVGVKNEFLRSSHPLSKVTYDGKINVIHHALGLHTLVCRVQGGKLKPRTRYGLPRCSGKHPWSFCA